MDFRTKEFLDKIYEKYYDTCEKTMEGEDTIGPDNYRYFIERVGEFMKNDIKDTKTINKKYEKFKEKALSLIIKMKRLNFSNYYIGHGWIIHAPEISKEDFELMNRAEMKKHLRSVRLFYKFKEKIESLIDNFISYIPKEWYSGLRYYDSETHEAGAIDGDTDFLATSSDTGVSEEENEESEKESEETSIEVSEREEEKKEKEENEETSNEVSEREKQENILEAISGNANCGEEETGEAS